MDEKKTCIPLYLLEVFGSRFAIQVMWFPVVALGRRQAWLGGCLLACSCTCVAVIQGNENLTAVTCRREWLTSCTRKWLTDT